ncbi:MAG: hypothetical protein R3275_07735 [Saprospiraceae bacterium]|nr:hypothetical protein [Saprospiraceae bacterium]
MMSIRFIFTLFLLVLAIQINGQEERAFLPTIEIGAGLGGQFYLNYLESNPMYWVRTGINYPSGEKSSFSLLAGVEGLRNETFVPLIVRYTYGQTNKFYTHFGYAFGLWSDVDLIREYDFSGGAAIGAGYQRSILMRPKLELLLAAGYEFRTAHLEFETSQPGSDVNSDLEYHFFSIGIKAML